MSGTKRKAATALLGTGLVVSGIVIGGFESGSIAGAARSFVRAFGPAWSAFVGAVQWVGRSLARSVSFVGPNPYVQALVLTLIFGLVIVCFFLAIAFLAGPLSGRRRAHPNPLDPPEDPSPTLVRGPTPKTSVASRTASPYADSLAVEVPVTPTNRSKLLHTAGALREIVRNRSDFERSRLSVELLQAEDYIVSNRLSEAFALLERISGELNGPSVAPFDARPADVKWSGAPREGAETTSTRSFPTSRRPPEIPAGDSV